MNETLKKRIDILKSMENIIISTLSDKKAFDDWCKFIRKNTDYHREHFVQLAENEELYKKTCESFKKILNKYSKDGFAVEKSEEPSNTFTVKTLTTGKTIPANSYKELAEIICEYGRTEDLEGYNQKEEKVFDTFGIYINRISDINFRENLLNFLIPMQKNIFIKDDLKDLNEKLINSYSAETSFDGKNWKKDNPTYGHCAVAALIVSDYFKNAEICKIKVDGVSHYFNVINGQVIDFTGEQFPQKLDYSNYEVSSREYLLSNENTKTRYQILKAKCN